MTVEKGLTPQQRKPAGEPIRVPAVQAALDRIERCVLHAASEAVGLAQTFVESRVIAIGLCGRCYDGPFDAPAILRALPDADPRAVQVVEVGSYYEVW